MASAFPVNAHSTLVSSVPSADSTVVDFPMEVTLTFNEELLKVGQENPEAFVEKVMANRFTAKQLDDLVINVKAGFKTDHHACSIYLLKVFHKAQETTDYLISLYTVGRRVRTTGNLNSKVLIST